MRARKLGSQLAEANKLHAQVATLEDRLRMMGDLLLSKSEEIAKLEADLAQAKAATAKPSSRKKTKPASGAKP